MKREVGFGEQKRVRTLRLSALHLLTLVKRIPLVLLCVCFSIKGEHGL